MVACSLGGCDFSVSDCMCGEKCYVLQWEPVERASGEGEEIGVFRIINKRLSRGFQVQNAEFAAYYESVDAYQQRSFTKSYFPCWICPHRLSDSRNSRSHHFQSELSFGSSLLLFTFSWSNSMESEVVVCSARNKLLVSWLSFVVFCFCNK